MKLTILTLCLCVLQVSASVTTIGQNFNLQIKNQALKEVLKEIESKTNYRFFYNDFIMDGSKQVTVNLSNKNIEQVMDELLNGSEVSYKILNNNLIVIAPALELQQNKVTGTILDKTGQPLPGVSILEKGTTNGTVSDVNGKYSLTVQNPNATLVFSFIGYNTEERPVASQSTIDVSMVENITQFDEIVVVGYGTQRQLTLTGSISKLSSEKLQNKPVSSIESALQGQVAGVSVVNTGAPGVSPTVRIRGVGSVNYSADPLYVIDGVAVGNLNNFDVRDMESVSILKDASAAAIYGSRAANGVVLITTKKGGRDGKMKLSIDASTGTQAAWKKLDLLKRDDYIKFGTTLLTNAGLSLPARWSKMNDPIYEGATQTYAQTETDWQDEMFRSAQISQLNVNLSGGTEKLRLYTSYGRFSQDGTMLGTDYNRHSFRINTDADLGKYFTIGEKVKASYSKTSNEKVSGGRTQLKHMLNQIPYIPVHDPTKTGGYRSADGSDGADPENPVRIALMDKSHTYVVNLVGNAFVDVKFTDWLKYRSSVGVEYSWTRKFIDNPIYNDGYNSRTDHYLEDDRNTYLSQVYTNQLTFDHTFEKHYVSAVIVAEKQTTSNTYLNGNGKNTTNDISELSGSSSQVLDGYLQETALLSYAGRLNYSYADKYLMSASMRRDGSSNLAPGHKWGNFPGASLGWVISKENFMKDMQAISNLKLRASYGTLGFNNLGAYPWQAVVYTNTTAVFNNDATYTGAYSTTKENKDLQWEITKMTNGGFDLALLDNSITFSAEYYIRKVDNLIVDNPMPPSMGLTDNPVANVGAMKNWGYDFTVGYSKQKGEFKYSVNANISFIKNEVTKLSANSPSIEKSGGTSDYGGYTITRTEGGHSIQGFYGWVTDGIFQKQTDIDNLNAKAPSGIYQTSSTKPGDIKFKDLNQDNVIDDKDKTYIGNFMPDFNYNINLTAEYKGFDVSLFFQGVQGNDIYNGTKVLTQGMARLFNQDKAVLNAWDGSDATKNTNIPRAISGDPNHNTRTSNRFVEDGSYLRLKNLTIGYNVPRLMLSKVFGGAFSGCRVYITGQNLLTFTKYTGYDPEVGSSSDYSGSSSARLLQGVDFGFSPQPRTFLFGINASF